MDIELRQLCLTAFEKDGALTQDEMEQHSIAKAKMLGNIKFIGNNICFALKICFKLFLRLIWNRVD